MTINVVEQIKNNISINTVIWYYLEWKKNIKWNHKYKCPFHWNGNEKTPSLYASDDRWNFKCFWCQKYWDIISFVMEYDKENVLTFWEALEEIKDTFPDEMTDIDISFKWWDKDYAYKKLIYELHEEVNDFMIESLNAKQWRMHLQYLTKERELDKELVDKFKIGYSESRKVEDKINKLLKTDKYKEIKIKDTGFVTMNTKWWDPYFLFTDRIMYPIINNRRKIVGWSGWKTYDKQEPKYINSVNNFIYNKSANLFNYDKVNFAQNRTIYICEWNLDSTQLYNYWADNAISLLGTNLTESQIGLFKNKVNQVVLLLDTDEAGWKALFKLTKMLLWHGIIPYMMNIAPQKDIDDFLKSNKQLKWKIKEYIDSNKKDILWEYMIDWYVLNQEKMTIEQRYDILTIVKDTYAEIKDDVIKNIYKAKLKKHDIEFEKLEDEYNENKKIEAQNFKKADDTVISNNDTKKWDYDKFILYAIYLIQNDFIDESDIESRNFELTMTLASHEAFNKYKDDIDWFNKKYPEECLEFDIIKNSKEKELFEI